MNIRKGQTHERRCRLDSLAFTLALMAGVLLPSALLTGAATPKTRTKQHDKAHGKSSTASKAAQPSGVTTTALLVTGSGTAGQLAKFAGDGTVVVNSTVQLRQHRHRHDDAGIEAHNSGNDRGDDWRAEVPGRDGAATSASGSLFTVAHDTTLQGDGRAGAPLGLAAPLLLSGSVNDTTGRGVITATNTVPGLATAILGIGGTPVPANVKGGMGLKGICGTASTSGTSGGTAVVGIGGPTINGASGQGGDGAAFLGGDAVNGSGGAGAFVHDEHL